jgi:AbrB family looped-hinge helix DNA binding protein
MNAETKMSAKGQVVIPKAIRDRLQWKEGASLEVVETGSGVLLRASGTARERISIDEFRRRHPPQAGPHLSLEQMDEAVAREAARRSGAPRRSQ